jgi:hypothetical protein
VDKYNMGQNTDRVESKHYLIQIQGNLPKRWSAWFNSMEIDVQTREDGEKITTLKGVLPDQAALFGVLERIRDLGLALLMVRIQEEEA